jgi:hypothetical protein
MQLDFLRFSITAARIPRSSLATVAGPCATTATLANTADFPRHWLGVAHHQFSFIFADRQAGV